MTDFFSHVLLVCFIIGHGLQQGRLHALESCEPEGSIQLAVNDTQEYIDSNNQTYHLLQVCLFGHWSYVCGNNFGHSPTAADQNVALFQLGCVSGGTQSFSNASSIVPAYLTSITCLGVERRLVDCHRGYLSNITSCAKVGAYCTESGDNLMCQNGDMQIRPGTIGIVEICDRGLYWRRLCPNEYFWGPPQAAVACRQLNLEKAVIGASAVTVTYASESNFLYHIQCTGDESRLTDCTIRYSINRNLCDGNEVAGVVCDIEMISSHSLKVPSSSAMILISTTTMTYTPVCSTQSIPWSLGTHASSTPVSCSCTSLVSSSLLPWVGGGIIGAVLSTTILLTVLAAVCLSRRRRRRRKTPSQYKIVNNNHIPDQKRHESPFSVDQNVAYGMHSPAQLVPISSKTYHRDSASMDDKLQIEENICYTSSVHESTAESMYSYAKWTTPNSQSCTANVNTSQGKTTSE